MSNKPLIQVRIDSQTGCAVVSVAPQAEGASLDAAALESLAAKSGVLVTDDVRKEIAALASDFNANPRVIEHTIACPIPPTTGDDGRIEWCDGFDPTVCQPSAAEGDRVDHYAGCAFVHVKPQSHVATIHEPTAGTDGVDVAGKPIKAKPGSPCPMRIDPTLAVDSEGRVVAQTEGAMCIKGGALKITKLLEVREHVDFSTGNINFDGCIDIREEVRDLFQIKATGGVSVGGLIEAATITCGGDFAGRRGMAGRGRGTLNVKGDAEVGFLNDMKGEIGGTLSVRREILNCELRVDGGLACEQCTIIGGTLDLRANGIVGTLGSGSQRPTRVVLTKDANLVVTKMIYPKVSFQIGRTVFQIERPTKGSVRIVADSPRSLTYRVADGAPRPMKEIAKLMREAA